MTEPVEGWIRRAGVRCAELGLDGLAQALFRHAKAESDHHLMMLADLCKLTSRWNSRRTPSVNADALIKEALSPGALHYCALHETNIAGPTPFAQLAIEYEIEMLPLRYGESVVSRCVEVLGVDVLSCLSFVTEHMTLDIEHTKFNARQLTKLIDLNPETMPSLIAAATSALDAYGRFLADCAELAGRHSGSLTHPQGAAPSFRWQLHAPLQASNARQERPLPVWLENARALRASVLWENGRRPQFKAEDSFCDPDPIDPYAYHILAYDGPRLVGCVRVYRLSSDTPPCLTETLLGCKTFSELLAGLSCRRSDTVEIGRWIVHPDFRRDRVVSLAAMLAAGSGALAMALASRCGTTRGLAICSVGTADHQDSMLARLGLTILRDLEPITHNGYNDDLRVCVCTDPQTLNYGFRRMMAAMANQIGITQSLCEIEAR
jgi:hypothetical protein